MPAVTPDRSTVPATRGERTAERILDEAEALFAERGYEGATLRDLAARVGIRTPSLYNHFPSKESLYVAVLERSVGPVLDVLGEFLEPGAAGYRDREQLVERVVDLLASHPALPRLVQHEALSGGQRLTPMLRAWVTPALRRAHEIVSDVDHSRHWHEDEIPLLVLAMYNVVVGYFGAAGLSDVLGVADLSSPEAIERHKRLVLRVSDALFGPLHDPDPEESSVV